MELGTLVLLVGGMVITWERGWSLVGSSRWRYSSCRLVPEIRLVLHDHVSMFGSYIISESSFFILDFGS